MELSTEVDSGWAHGLVPQLLGLGCPDQASEKPDGVLRHADGAVSSSHRLMEHRLAPLLSLSEVNLAMHSQSALKVHSMHSQSALKACFALLCALYKHDVCCSYSTRTRLCSQESLKPPDKA